MEQGDEGIFTEKRRKAAAFMHGDIRRSAVRRMFDILKLARTIEIVEYRSNNNVVFSCKYHVVWCPKYRRKLLVGAV